MIRLDDVRKNWSRLLVAAAILAAALLPLNLLTTQPLHHDEALYATWGLTISSGQDIALAETPVDKPPLFLYTLSGLFYLMGASGTTARLPSLVATMVTVGLTFGLGRVLYGSAVGVVAAWLVALSPFTLMFAPTALTDPLLVALLLTAGLLAAGNRSTWAGVALGLAIATKQQGLFFTPLIIGLILITASPPVREETPSGHPTLTGRVGRFLGGMGGIVLLVLAWDVARSQPSALFQQSVRNYGGLSPTLTGFDERTWAFLELTSYVFVSPLLNGLLVVGLPLLLGYGTWRFFANREADRQQPLADGLLALFCVAFLGLHALLSFQIWDRYLLGLVPLLAMLLARVLLWPWRLLKARRGLPAPATYRWASTASAIILALLIAHQMLGPVSNAVQGRYPLGSNSRALAGIEQMAAYLRGNIGAGHTLHHRWLGTHWRFYLWDYPYDLQFWPTARALAAKAQPGHLIALPSWRSDVEVRLALYEKGLSLHELHRVYRSDGSPSISLYQLQPIDEVPAIE